MKDAKTHITFSSLDPSQRYTLEQIINDDESNLHVVYGPPGTGKSQLVVSLLERLAASGQKVLFVSQNTEALRVVERMIRKTERIIGYPVDDSYFSLLDMCLMLHDPAHRKLKYLREHAAVVCSKIIKTLSAVEEPEGITYKLQYTNLDHDANYRIESDIVGFDELAAYYLKYVTTDFAPEVLNEFEKINVRKVLKLVDNYKHPELFGDFVHPRRELCLLATSNLELNLPVVRENVRKLKNAIASRSNTQTIPAKSTLSIIEYLDLLLAYSSLTNIINIYAVSTMSQDIDEVIEQLTQVIQTKEAFETQRSKLTDELNKCQRGSKYSINNITPDTPDLELSPILIRSAEDNIDQAIADLQSISELISEINSFARGFKYSSPQDLQINLAKALFKEYHLLLEQAKANDAEILWTLNASQLQQLHSDLRQYFAVTGVKKIVRRVPESFVDLDLKSHQWMEFYRNEFLDAMEQIQPILSAAQHDTNWLIELSDQPAKTSLSKLGINYQNNDMLLHYITVSSQLYALLEKYHLSNLDYDELVKTTKRSYESLKLIQELWLDEANGRNIFKHGLQNFITEFKKSKASLSLEQQIEQSTHEYESNLATQYEQCKPFLINLTDARTLEDKSPELIKKLQDSHGKFTQIAAKLEIPIKNLTIDQEYLNHVKACLLEINQANCLSEFAFTIEVGKNLTTWLDKILVLEQYSNDAELADFVEHNNYLAEVQAALGEANQTYLKEVLSQEGLDYHKFTARLISTVVRESYGRSVLSDRRYVRDDTSFFKQYAHYLKNQKLRSYTEGLSSMYENCVAAMKVLARQDTLRAAGKSNFDKFRDNTTKILDAFPIVCATPKEVAKYLAPIKGEFDYVIFDEASQLLPGQALPSIFRAKKAVIIGDPHQMPPSLNLGFGMTESDDEDEDFGDSILDLVCKQPQRQYHLKVHYRSHYNKLFEPSRCAIYAKEGIEPIFEAEPAKAAPIAIEDNLGDSCDELGYDSNFAKICASAQDYIRDNNTLKDEPGAIFCILFARGEVLAQFKRYLAEDSVNRRFSDVIRLYNQDKILLSTVTNCQGIEGLYTIIYLQHYTSPAAMWFFKESAGAYKRLNVAITRQREGLKLLLANPQSAWISACENKIDNPNTGPQARLSAELMKSLLENAGEDTNYLYLERTLGDNINHFDSPFTEQLYHKLEEHYSSSIGKTLRIYSEVGWNLLIPTSESINHNERNIGFRIDLGIYSITQRKFILGIEMDGATYHSGHYKEQSDFNRQQVLESKGWNLHRIWSTNWLNDAEREFERLTAKIDELLSS